jgi:hypothetical protein
MRALLSTAMLIAMSLIVVPSAEADWWSDHNPFRPITPHWGPLIPHPQSAGTRSRGEAGASGTRHFLNRTCVGRAYFCKQLISGMHAAKAINTTSRLRGG